MSHFSRSSSYGGGGGGGRRGSDRDYGRRDNDRGGRDHRDRDRGRERDGRGGGRRDHYSRGEHHGRHSSRNSEPEYDDPEYRKEEADQERLRQEARDAARREEDRMLQELRDRKTLEAALTDVRSVNKKQRSRIFQTITELCVERHSGSLLPSFLPRVAELQIDTNPDTRKFVCEFIEAASMKHPQTSLPLGLPVIKQLMSDENRAVVKRSIVAFIDVFAYALKLLADSKEWDDSLSSLYSLVINMSTQVEGLIESTKDSIRNIALRFMELEIITFTRHEEKQQGQTDPSNTNPAAASSSSSSSTTNNTSGTGSGEATSSSPASSSSLFMASVNEVPINHKHLKVAPLQRKAKQLQDSFGKLLRSSSLSATNITLILNALTNIYHKRPHALGPIASIFVSYAEFLQRPDSLFSNKPGSRKRVQHALGTVLLSMLKYRGAKTHFDEVVSALAKMGRRIEAIQTRNDTLKAMGEGRVRHRDMDAEQKRKAALASLKLVADLSAPVWKAVLERLSSMPGTIITDLVMKSMENFPAEVDTDSSRPPSELFQNFLSWFNPDQKKGEVEEKKKEDTDNQAKYDKVPPIPVPILSSEQLDMMSNLTFERLVSLHPQDDVGVYGNSSLWSTVVARLATSPITATATQRRMLLDHVVNDFENKHSVAQRWLWNMYIQETEGGVNETIMALTGGRGGVATGVKRERESEAEEKDDKSSLKKVKSEDEQKADMEIEESKDGKEEKGKEEASMDVEESGEMEDDGEGDYGEGEEEEDEEAHLSGHVISSLPPIVTFEDAVLSLIAGLERVWPVADPQGLFADLVINLPVIIPSVLQRILKYCTDDVLRMPLGLSTLRSLILHRPECREQCLSVILDHATSENTRLRGLAVSIVAKDLFQHEKLQGEVQTRAETLLSSLTLTKPPTVQALENAVKKLEAEKKAAEEVKEGVEESEEVLLKKKETALLRAREIDLLQKELIKKRSLHLHRYLDLFLALCDLSPPLITVLARVFGGCSKEIQEEILTHVPKLISSVGAENENILNVISKTEKVWFSFGYKILTSVISSTPATPATALSLSPSTSPSPAVVKAALSAYDRIHDPRLLIPIIAELDKSFFVKQLKRILRLSPSIVQELVKTYVVVFCLFCIVSVSLSLSLPLTLSPLFVANIH